MYHIAICDDDRNQIDRMAKLMSEHAAKTGFELVIERFTRTGDLRARLLQGIKYTIIYLDIKFDREDDPGIQLGRWIRYSLKDGITILIFMSGHMDYVENMFVARPQDYIRKPFYNKSFTEKFVRALQYYDKTSCLFFEFKTGKSIIRLDFNEIMYVWIYKQSIHIKTLTTEYSYYGTLSDAFEQLKEYDFILASKGSIVNYSYISSFRNKEIIMKDGETIPLDTNSYNLLVELSRQVRIRHQADGYAPKKIRCNTDADLPISVSNAATSG